MSSDHLFRNATLALQEILAKIDQDRTSFEKDSRELQEFKEKMQQTRPGRSTKVRLDVGGCVFATSVSTLQSERSLLSAMFSGNFELTKDPDGCYFIDRNPEYFRKILDYLRKGKKLSLGGMSRFQLEAFYDEAVYYELESLVELLKNAMEVQRERLFQFQWQFDSSTDVDFSDDRYTVTAVSMKFRTVLGAKSFSSGKHCWKVRVIHSGRLSLIYRGKYELPCQDNISALVWRKHRLLVQGAISATDLMAGYAAIKAIRIIIVKPIIILIITKIIVFELSLTCRITTFIINSMCFVDRV
jgi:hypothetical protein